MTTRDDTIQGLHQLADWLTLNPTVPAPTSGQNILVSLRTNQAVRQLADQLDTEVTVDHEGNCSTELHFGAISYVAYGYTDFATHLDAAEGDTARRYAARHNLTLTPKETTAA